MWYNRGMFTITYALKSACGLPQWRWGKESPGFKENIFWAPHGGNTAMILRKSVVATTEGDAIQSCSKFDIGGKNKPGYLTQGKTCLWWLTNIINGSSKFSVRSFPIISISPSLYKPDHKNEQKHPKKSLGRRIHIDKHYQKTHPDCLKFISFQKTVGFFNICCPNPCSGPLFVHHTYLFKKSKNSNVEETYFVNDIQEVPLGTINVTGNRLLNNTPCSRSCSQIWFRSKCLEWRQ